MLLSNLKPDLSRPMCGATQFYINVVDKPLRGVQDNKIIGLLLCNGGDKVMAQYAQSDYKQPVDVSDYQIIKAILVNLKTARLWWRRLSI